MREKRVVVLTGVLVTLNTLNVGLTGIKGEVYRAEEVGEGGGYVIEHKIKKQIVRHQVKLVGKTEEVKLEGTNTKVKMSPLGEFELTAYCPCELCCEEWWGSPANKKTSIGVGAYQGITVAVDPRVIPYGTKIYVEGVGTFIATDCGGAIKGQRLDIYFINHDEATAFGRKKRNVYIIEEEGTQVEEGGIEYLPPTPLPEIPEDEYVPSMGEEYIEEVGIPQIDEGYIEEKPPSVEGDVPPVEENKPIVEENKPIVEENKPIVEEKPPIVEENKPIVEDRPPIVEESKPIVEDKPPIVEESKPIVEENKPIVEETPPKVEEKPPIVEEKPPIVEENKPIVEENKPIVEENKPIVEEKPQKPTIKPSIGGEAFEIVN